jgi:hypothetical protein
MKPIEMLSEENKAYEMTTKTSGSGGGESNKNLIQDEILLHFFSLKIFTQLVGHLLDCDELEIKDQEEKVRHPSGCI